MPSALSFPGLKSEACLAPRQRGVLKRLVCWIVYQGNLSVHVEICQDKCACPVSLTYGRGYNIPVGQS
jgi:hypothetical protein